MSQLFNTNNPGIGDVNELTLSEEIFIQNLAGLSYQEGDIIYHDGSFFARLPIGNVNEILQVNSTEDAPFWGVALTVSATPPSNPKLYDLWVEVT